MNKNYKLMFFIDILSQFISVLTQLLCQNLQKKEKEEILYNFLLE
jgi:hypothetical protein